MPGNITTTGIDSLAEYIKSHGETNINTIATALGIDAKSIEQWAKILENAKAVKIVYKLDTMYISPIVPLTSEQLESTNKIAEVNENILQSGIESDNAELDKLEKKLEELNRNIRKIDNIFLNKAKNPKILLNGLNSIEKKADIIFREMKKKEDYVKESSAKIDIKLNSMKEIPAKIKDTNDWSENLNKIVNDLKNNIKLVEETNHFFKNKFDNDIENQKKNVYDLFNLTNEKLIEINEIAKQKQREAENEMKNSKIIEREINKAISEIERERDRIINNSAKQIQDIEILYTDAQKKRENLSDIIKEYRKQFGDIGEFDAKLVELKNEIESVKKEIDETRKNIEGLKQQNVKKNSNKKKNIVKKEITNKEDITNRINKINSKVEKIDKGIDDLVK
jgi:chromosome segregation protein